MRQIFELLNRSPPEHRSTSGSGCALETTMPSQGFTAVNGLDRGQPTSLENMTGSITEPTGESNMEMISDAARDEQQISRPSESRNDSVLCPEPPIKLSPDSMKRKRSIADSIEQASEESILPATAIRSKRRMTGVDHTTHSLTPEEPSAAMHSEDRMSLRATVEMTSRDRCSREQSPVPTRNQREAPPQVRPETQAHLAESLATHLQEHYKSTSTSVSAPEAPTTTSQTDSPNKAYSIEDAGVDPTGKRKRNFSNRTKTGCHTCRQRKKKCDEAKPECTNCTRGGHDCLGYGLKPLNYKGPNASRTHVPLQSKAQDNARLSSPPPDEQDGGPRYDHWGRIPPAPGLQEHHHRLPSLRNPYDIRRPSRDSWSSQNYQYRPETSYPYGAVPHSVEHSQSMPPGNAHSRHPYSPPPHEAWQYPFPPPEYRANPRPAMTVSSRDSMGTHSSSNPSSLYFPSSQISELEKMLLGKPYLAYIDTTLLEHRAQCKVAVERFNEASHSLRSTTFAERDRLFAAILDPPPGRYDYPPSILPAAPTFNRPGRVGHRLVVQAPFKCDYGYNIEIGDDVVISANCYMQDPCDIVIGHRVYIAENVHFCGNLVSRDTSMRKGSQGCLVGGSIVVEDDVDIGPGAIIMAHRIVGKGSSVAAGSIVTRNVPPYTEVAGNPARIIRSLPRPDETGDESAGMDKDILDENERSVSFMKARRGVREQGR